MMGEHEVCFYILPRQTSHDVLCGGILSIKQRGMGASLVKKDHVHSLTRRETMCVIPETGPLDGFDSGLLYILGLGFDV
jgi:hypothetical protein